MTPPYGDGVGRVLNQAWAYELLQRAAGSNRSHVSFVTEYVKLRPGDRILDVGCGPGHILRALPPDVEYVGIDPDARYIESARAHWSDRGVFHVADGRDSYSSDRPFDIVLAMGRDAPSRPRRVPRSPPERGDSAYAVGTVRDD